MKTVAFAAAIAVLCFGCRLQTTGGSEQVEDDGQGEAVAGVESPPMPISCEGLEHSLIPAELTRSGMMEHFGAPDSTSGTAEPNRHVPGAIDSLHAMYYPGFQVGFRTPAGARDMVTNLTVMDNRYVADSRIGIGAAASEVRGILGEPRRHDSEALVYDCGEGAEQPVTFHLANGRVAMITVEYYVD